MNYYVGVDFSINYPGVCIASHDFRYFKWIACINTDVPRKFRTFLEDLMLEFPNIKFIFVEGKQRKDAIYHRTEQNKLSNQIDLATAIVNGIKLEINNQLPIIALEGLSFGSPGNSLIDLAHATGIVKSFFYKYLVNQDKDQIYVFSPSELKNAIKQKGNCGKIEIFNAFSTDPVISSLRESDLFKLVTKYRTDIFNGKVVKSPIMDMIDATLPILKFHAIITG